ncbi:MAG: right-handed parallel beta-helix repeat-containing protein [Lachnospiraceae bacterium]|nr:right-handed parallel beta-helix repeat-containing protein [Lachnospiraceae bacterium]
MKLKKILAAAMSLVMIASYAPTVSADGAGTHGASGHFVELNHNHSDGTWTAWGAGSGESSSLPKTSGKYYLTRDITVTSQQRITASADIELCLNGHNINATAASWGTVYQVYNNLDITLKVENCSSSGKITRSVSSGSALTGSTASARGSIEFTNLVFEGITGTSNGTCITMQGATSLTMNSCTITGCSSTGYGFAIFDNSTGAVVLNNCSITNNTLTGTSSTAGVSPIRAGSSADITLNNCLITGNTGKNASVYYGPSGSQLTVKDTEITGNQATNTGSVGAIYTIAGGVTVEGSTVIRDNIDSEGSAADLTNQNATATFHIKNTTDDTNVRLKYINAPTVTELADITGELRGTWTYTTDPTKKLIDNGSGALVLADIVRVTGVSVSTSELELIPGGTAQLTASVLPADADDTVVTWSSSLGTVATVDSTGLVTAAGFGNAVITATTSDGGFTASCTVTVSAHSHRGNEYTAWESTDSLPTEAGYYYLENDVELSSVYNVSANIGICLDGHSITAAAGTSHRMIAVNSGYTLTIDDCSMAPGVISGGVSNYGGGIQVKKGAVLNLYGGIISGNRSTADNGGEGGGVYVQGRGYVTEDGNTTYYDGGVFNMFGGKITGNEGRLGSAIHLYGYGQEGAEAYEPGKVNIYGGEISGNSAVTSAIYVRQYGVLNISGGTFTGNTSTGNAGVIQSNAGSVVTITGGTFTGNTAGGNGGVIWSAAGNNLIISNAVMTGNTAVRGSAILHNNTSTAAGALVLSDVTITGNTSIGDSSGNAEAVYFNTGTLELSELCVITGNYYYGSPRDIRLNSGKTFAIGSGGLSEGSMIGLQINSVSCGTAVATGATAGEESYFTLNSQAGGALCYSGGSLLYTDHIHDGVSFIPWTASDSLPTTAGHYFLTSNVTLAAEVDLYDDVVICLNGKTISATANSGNGIFVLREAGVKLTLTDCSDTPGALTGGNTGSGGAVYLFPGSELEIRNISIRGNSVDNAGGAIYAKGSTAEEVAAGVTTSILIDNVTFTNNTASASTTNADGGVMYLGRGVNAYIKDSTFTGNTGKNASVFYATTTVGGLTLEGCTITNNKCTANSSTYSGAVYMVAGGLTLKGYNYIADNYYRYDWWSSYMIANVTIQNTEGTFNIVDSADDAYVKIKYAQTKSPGHMGNITGELSGSYIWTSDTSYIFDVIDGGLYLLQPWSSNGSLPASGAYYLTTGVNVSSTTAVTGDLTLCLHGKTVTVGASAGAYSVGSDYAVVLSSGGSGSFACDEARTADLISASAGTLSLYDLTFTGMTVGDGAALISLTGTSAATLKNCGFSDNTVGNRGCVYAGASGATLLDCCTFSGNSSQRCPAVLCESSGLTFKDCLVTNNTITASGSETGAVILNAAATFEGGNRIAGNSYSGVARDVLIKTGVGFAVSNASRDQAIRLTSSSSFLNERLGVILSGELLGSYQWAPDSGYAVTASGNDIVLAAKPSYSNIVYNGKTYAPWTDTASVPSSNPSASGVDGYYLTDDVFVTTTTAVSSRIDLCLNGKDITLFAPAVYGVYRTTSGTVNIVNSIDGSGTISGSGVTVQALFFTSSSSTSSGSINLSNIAISDFTNCDKYGHAVVMQGAAAFTADGCTFENNAITSSSGGAALYLTGSGNTSITNCVFRNCSSVASGGAVIVSGTRTISFTGNTFDSCSTATTGGGMIVGGSTSAVTLTASGNTFNNCSAGSNGGGMAFLGSGMVVVDENNFIGCTAGEISNGGGLYVNAYETAAVIKGNTFTGCHAGYGGGVGVYYSGNSVIGGPDEPNTFSGCSSSNGGGSIYVMGSSREFNFGNNEISDNIFAGEITGDAVAIGSRGFMTVSGRLDATGASFGSSGSLVVCKERATLTIDGAQIDVPPAAEAVRGFGTVYAEDCEIGGKTVIDAAYNMWMIQMDSMLVARGDVRANVVLTKNDGSWFSSQTGGFAEIAPLIIQGENLGPNARINLTIPGGGDIAEYVLGPADITGRGTSYVVTQGVVLPGYELAPESESGYDYDITSVQMIIDTQLSMTYYVTADNPLTQARFFVDNSETQVEAEYVSREATDYGFKFTVSGLSPKDMTANIRIEILDGEGDLVTSKDDFCIVDYFDALYQAYRNDSGARAEALRQLIADLIRYGDAAQIFSGSEAALPSTGRSWISGYVRSGLTAPAQNGFAMTEMSAAPYIRAAGLTLNDRVELVFRTVAAAADTATLEYSDDGENWSIVPGLDGTMDELLGTGTGYIVSEISHGYEIRILSLMPHQYGRLYRLTVGENGHAQVTYSVNSYIYRMWESSSVGTLVSCLYAYELSAAAYAGLSL